MIAEVDFFTFFEKMGFPAGVAGTCLFILWKLTKPISDAHVRNVDAVSKANAVNADANAANARSNEQLTQLTKALIEMVRDQSSAIRDLKRD